MLGLNLADVYVMADYPIPELPTLTPYLRTKYRDLPEQEVNAIVEYASRLMKRRGVDLNGPAPGQDEKTRRRAKPKLGSRTQWLMTMPTKAYSEFCARWHLGRIRPFSRHCASPKCKPTAYSNSPTSSRRRYRASLVTELPGIDVRLDADLPASGSAHWENGRWVITLKSGEPLPRRRFSLMHEFKHVLDHPTKEFLYGDTIADSLAAYRAERAADQFAACVLMPERWIKREWFTGGAPLDDVATRFGVSPRALSVRLWLLGMAPQVKRWATMPRQSADDNDPTRYYRAASDLEVAC